MKPEGAIFEDENAAADATAITEARADIEAGRVVSHDAMKHWLLSWGTPDEGAAPEIGD